MIRIYDQNGNEGWLLTIESAPEAGSGGSEALWESCSR
jgi:hypothetical protein